MNLGVNLTLNNLVWMYVQSYLNKDVSLEKIVHQLNQILIYLRYQTQVSCRMTDQYASSTLSITVTSTINEHTSSMITNQSQYC